MSGNTVKRKTRATPITPLAMAEQVSVKDFDRPLLFFVRTMTYLHWVCGKGLSFQN